MEMVLFPIWSNTALKVNFPVESRFVISRSEYGDVTST